MKRAKLKDLRELIDRTIAKNLDRIAYKIIDRSGSVRSISNEEFFYEVKSLAAYIYSKDIGICGIVSDYSYRQQVCYYALIYAGVIVVPIEASRSKEEVNTIIETAKCDMLLVSDSCKELVDWRCGVISHIFLSDRCETAHKDSVEHLIIQGREIFDRNNEIFDFININPDSPYTYIPESRECEKLVMLSHKNIIRSMYAAAEIDINGIGVMAVLNPASQNALTLWNTLSLEVGNTIIINPLNEDFERNLALFSPTTLVLEFDTLKQIYSEMWNSFKKQGIDSAVRRTYRSSAILRAFGMDMRRGLFKKVYSYFGGELTSIYCNGPIDDMQIIKEIRAWGVNIYVGLSKAECTYLVSYNSSTKKSRMLSCGTAVNCDQIKVIPLHENSNGYGYVWVKGDNVMLGYYNNSKATSDTIDESWCNTGVLGKIDRHGYLFFASSKRGNK